MSVTTFPFQSTHSRGVRHLAHALTVTPLAISIHALTRSATNKQCEYRRVIFISIHALTRSATVILKQNAPEQRNFNPRTHEECDCTTDSITSFMDYFNPRTHEECDRISFLLHPNHPDFNPRTHEECDQKPRSFELIPHQFQSTHSRGVRLSSRSARQPDVRISIHALTRSATGYDKSV